MYLVTAAEMREVDRQAVEMGIPALVLMENAGKSVAKEVAALLRAGATNRTGGPPTVVILAGPGQNGGDGFCAARHLSSMGYRVRVGFFGDESDLPAEARANYEALRAYPVEVNRFCEVAGPSVSGSSAAMGFIGDVDVVVDALLGTGQRGDPRPPIDAAVRWINAAHKKGIPVVACDVPTGLDADSGRPFDPVVSATVTVTMGFPKIGLYSYPGRIHAGRIVVETLALPPSLLERRFAAKAVFVEDAREHMPARQADHHKGLSGHVTVLAGSMGMAGAAVLSAKAALRAGAGTVTLLCPGEVYGVCASMVPEAMVLPCGSGPHFTNSEDVMGLASDLARRSSCVVVGPGFGRDGGQAGFLSGFLPIASSVQVPCLIDADGLYALPSLGGLSYLAGLGGKFILTPHPGELAHLVGTNTREIGSNRPAFAVGAALDSKSIVCLKGAGTCVANSSGDVWVNTSGDPAMATAGSGDVLSGVIAALVSQGLSPFNASWLGVFWHGLAGEIARRKVGSFGALAGDLCDSLPPARQAIEGSCQG
ncbi:MAG: NAD(P)H-hydrate dehydratase [Bacillota bacterium]